MLTLEDEVFLDFQSTALDWVRLNNVGKKIRWSEIAPPLVMESVLDAPEWYP